METKTKQVYYCDHCKKHGLSKHHMERHEKYCNNNPDNYTECYGCDHLQRHTETNDEGTCTLFNYYTCSAKKIRVHNLLAVRKKLPERYPEQFEESTLMPKECSLFTYCGTTRAEMDEIAKSLNIPYDF